MKLAYRKFLFWSPVIMRGFLWIVIAMITEFLLNTKDMTRETVAKFFWLDWVKLTLSTILPGFIAWRTFLDQSITNHENKNAAINNPGSTG